MNKSGNLYPFVTKATIKSQLETDPDFRVQAMAILHTLQTEHEQATKSTLNKNRQGFMSSHAVKGSKVAEKIKAGEKLTEEDWRVVDSIAPRYSRQLATYMRAKAIAENPALAQTAALFSADKNLPAAPASEPELVEEESVEEVSEPDQF